MPNVRRMGYLLTLIFGAALLTAMAWKPAPPPRFVGVAAGDVPRSLAGLAAPQDDVVPADTRAALASADLLSRTYRPAGGNGAGGGADGEVNFVLIGGTDRSALHDPRSCLIGAGMQLADDHLERLGGTGVEARACHALGAAGQPGCDMLYFYVVNGRVINQVTQIRAAMLASALLGRRGTPVYFLRFTRPLDPDPQAEAQGHARLQGFAADMWARLQPRLAAPAE